MADEPEFIQHPPYEKSEREKKINALCETITATEGNPVMECVCKNAQHELLKLIEG